MKAQRYTLLPLALLVAFLPLLGCNGNGPTSASGNGRTVLHGVALGQDATASSTGDVSAMASKKNLVVTVEGTDISTSVAPNGTFELEGLPTGTITLSFTLDGVLIGTITIDNVSEGSEIKIVVHIKKQEVVLIELEIDDNDDTDDDGDESTCMINGGKVGSRIELEGSVDSGDAASFMMQVNGERASDLVTVDASSAEFECHGKSQKNGNDDPADEEDTCDTALSAGDQIHVRGTLESCTLTSAEVIATEVKIQKDESDDEGADD